MARRRALTGRPLLLASSATLALASCAKHEPPIPPVGNLMAPQVVHLDVCVDVIPADGAAEVQVNGVLATDRCTGVEVEAGEPVVVLVRHPMYGVFSEVVEFADAERPVVIDLTSPLLPPTGNLMAPRPDRSEGGLRPPGTPRE